MASTNKPSPEAKLFPGMDLLWGKRTPSSRGPKPGLDLAAIVDKAVRLAQNEGLHAVSMSRVAKELGFTTMSLYRYVQSKDELMVLMQESVLPDPDPPAAGSSWREQLSQWTLAYLMILRQNPWFVHVPITAPPLTPKNLAFMEAGLSAMADTKLRENEKIAMIMVLSGYVRDEARLMGDISAAQAQAGFDDDQADRVYWRLLDQFTDPDEYPDRYPAIRRLLASEQSTEQPIDGGDAEFIFGLETILNGIEMTNQRRS